MEAIGPAVAAWMKKTDKSWWRACQAAQVASLVVVALGAGPSQVPLFRITTMLAAYNVVDLTAPKRVFFVNETILADMVGSGSDQEAQAVAHFLTHGSRAGGLEPWRGA